MYCEARCSDDCVDECRGKCFNTSCEGNCNSPNCKSSCGKLSEGGYWSGCTVCEMNCHDGCDTSECKGTCYATSGLYGCWDDCEFGCVADSACTGGCGFFFFFLITLTS